jgi:hypothetical protein
MKDTSASAWKCGEGAKQSCKCHGTLWYGPTVRPDDKKPITTWEELRHWKTMEKQSDEWMSCTDAEFGGDPFPEQEKQCWCEDKPAYKPHRCADEGDECVCEGGWVVYGAKTGADKKPLDFFGTIKLSMAVTGTRENRVSLVLPQASTELIQLQMLTRHASVIKTRNSSTRASSKPPSNSGNHPNLSNNLKLSSRRLLSTSLRLLKQLKKRKLKQLKAPLLKMLRTAKLSLK